MPKNQVGLFDGSFPGRPSCSLGGEADFAPQYLEYVRNSFLPVTFYTDMKLDYVLEAPDDVINVALLIEPPATSDTHYRRAFELQEYFHYILSFDVRFCQSLPNNKGFFYPYGGTWLPDVLKINTKSRKWCSFILSEKQSAPGHKLRHRILPLVKEYGVDIFGRGINPFDSKAKILNEYYYTIVVESCQLDSYFSEKLIDAFLTCTVPVYWGCPTINNFFEKDGIITFETPSELKAILDVLYENYAPYGSRIDSIMENLHIADNYSITEDWIAREYPFILEKAK